MEVKNNMEEYKNNFIGEFNHSMLDTDLYKATVSYGYMKLYPHAYGTFMFVDRNHTKISDKMWKKIIVALEELRELRLTHAECEWACENIPFIPRYYWEWLKTFRFNPDKIKIYRDKNNELHIEVTDYMYKVTWYEVHILAIISEIFSAEQNVALDWSKIRLDMVNKMKIANEHGFRFSEFGTRRRFSYEVQKFIINTIKHNDSNHVCTGTSNMHFAMMFDMKVMGTHPHEWFMFHGAQFGYKHANYMALDAWQNVYDGDLGIALTDTYTSNVFFKNFTMKHAKLFDGLRHDSGSPFVFADKAIQRYKEHGINPMTKTIIFSDGLDFNKCIEITNYCMGRINFAFGIGTNLTNDIDGAKPSNIVMKLIECGMTTKQPLYPCIKLSDVDGKHLGDPKEIEHAIYELGI